jgi:Domain of unknown function (DUF4145)
MAKKPLKETFIVDCPSCKAKVAAEEEGRAQRTGYDEYASEPYGYRLSVGKCPRCKTLLVGSSHQTAFQNWEGEEDDVWTDPVRVYPEPPKIFSSHRIPSTVSVSLAEGSNVLQANSPIAACAMFGRALEAVCRDILFTPEEKKAVAEGTSSKRLMLATGIRQLRDKDIIDARLFDWSQHLHAFRNLAAHPDGDTAAISRQDAEDLKTFVYAIIEYIYDLADRYDEFKRRQAKRAKTKEDSKATAGLTRL